MAELQRSHQIVVNDGVHIKLAGSSVFSLDTDKTPMPSPDPSMMFNPKFCKSQDT